MGQEIQKIAPSPCCGAESTYDGVLTTESAFEYAETKNESQEIENPLSKDSDTRYEEFIQTIHTYELQVTQFQQQLRQKDEVLDQYKAQIEGYQEVQKYKPQPIHTSNSVKTDGIKQTTDGLADDLDKYKHENTKLKHTRDALQHKLTELTNIIDAIESKSPHVMSDDDDAISLLDTDDDLEETQMQHSGLLLQKYKSKKEMLDDELIEILLQMDLPHNAIEILGDRCAYDLPSNDGQKDAYFHLERDLRKIKNAFKGFQANEPRKYTKICILKHYKILTAIYTKYCKIGGDSNWLNLDGYVSLLRDMCTISTQNTSYFDIFDDIHHASNATDGKAKKGLTGLYGSQEFHDKDPWTGIWCKYEDKERILSMEESHYQRQMKLKQSHNRNSRKNMKEQSEIYYEKYKLRQVGERRIIGCMNSRDYAEMGGTFDQSNYKKAEMEINFKKRRIKVHNQRRLWFCELIPPQSLVDDIIMNVKWEEINARSYKNKQGTLKLYKHGELKEDDGDIPVPALTGLSRSQFFDAMLCCAKIWDEQQHELIRDLYLCFDDFVSIMDDYIYKNHCELSKYLFGKEIQDDVKDKLKTHNTVLIKLFKKYASLDPNEDATKHTEEMDCDEWTAMAVELCKVAKLWDQDIWKMGGKPSIEEMIQCFTLSLDEDELLNRKEMSFGEFQRCLVVFTNCIFKYHPNAKYNIIGFTDKLDLVLKWCETLESQKIKISSASYMNSATLKQIKRKRESMKQVAQTEHPMLAQISSVGSVRGLFIASP